ncbi:hypothetical protein PVK06_020109 [Gossypium arboreum]|uniref:Aminotransferase-like plant mobile domain-containing protein n=1 Tax=Gossypium arboreum TaxID=29729 RepID=A0ABR0PM20_GOSAR|nr:hypothetical protein PVK06_020109 [Gossypium arboreum]
MAWLRRNFGELDKDSTKVKREQHDWAYFLMFGWKSYGDPTISECILSKLLVNPKIWHVKVSLVMYATMEMHELNRVLPQFGFRQSILVAPYDLDDLHSIDLWGRSNENWIRFHAEYINIWNNRCKLLPHREAIIALELACYSEYMPWFRLLGKPYLLSKER